MKGKLSVGLGVTLLAAIAFLTIAPGLIAGPAHDFFVTMPFGADWSRLSLATGDYSFSLSDYSANGLIRVYHDNKAVGIVHAQTFDGTESKSEQAELVLIRHDGKVSVRELRVPGVGTYYFQLPKDLNQIVTQRPNSVDTITVEVQTK